MSNKKNNNFFQEFRKKILMLFQNNNYNFLILSALELIISFHLTLNSSYYDYPKLRYACFRKNLFLHPQAPNWGKKWGILLFFY